jgi:hypothetical protein
LLVSEFGSKGTSSKGTSIAGLLKHAGEPIGLFGVVKWHNVLKFAVELLGLQGQVAVTEFANHILAASTVEKVTGEMGVPGAAALQPLLAACTLEHIALDVSGDVLDGAGDTDGAKASSVLADGLKLNTTCTSMSLTGIHASDVVEHLNASSVLSVLDISKSKFGAGELKLLAGALETNTCGLQDLHFFVIFVVTNIAFSMLLGR